MRRSEAECTKLHSASILRYLSPERTRCKALGCLTSDAQPLRCDKEVHAMRSFGLSALIALSFVLLPPVSAASAAAWEPATASGASAGATHSTFIIQASVTLPQSCYAARIRSTPITLHTPRSFFVEQRAPSSPCGGGAYHCTIVSPNFPLPIPHSIEVISKGQRSKVTVATEEPPPTPPLCRKS
jgi:hypothetical protein